MPDGFEISVFLSYKGGTCSPNHNKLFRFAKMSSELPGSCDLTLPPLPPQGKAEPSRGWEREMEPEGGGHWL